MRALFPALMALGLASTATAEELPPPAPEVVSIALRDDACPVVESRRVELTDLLANPDRYRDGCLLLSGIGLGRTLYTDARSDSARLGLYGSERVLRKLNVVLAPVEVTGYLWGRCEDGRVTGGYCHNVARGPYFVVGQVVRVGPR